MNRHTPLKRGKPLKAGKPLARGPHGLTRTTTLKARKVPRAFRQRRDPQYIAFIRTQPCLIGGPWRAKLFAHESGALYEHLCLGAVQAAHVKSRGAGGDDHGNVVPLCLGAHEQQHHMGIKSFQDWWHVDLKAAAARLFEQYQRETGAP